MDFSHDKVLSLTDFLSEPLTNILICHYTKLICVINSLKIQHERVCTKK